MAKKNTKDVLGAIADKFAVLPPDTLPDGTVVAPRWSSGIKPLDTLLGGGFPKGKIVAFGSEEGVGKTTILLHAALNIIENYGKKVVYMDIEGGVSYSMLEGIGLLPHLRSKDNPDGLFYLLSLETIQDINSTFQLLKKDGNVALTIIDSDTNVIDATVLEAEAMGATKNTVAEGARMWSANFKKINAIVKRTDMCLVVIHQARTDLSGFHVVMRPSGGKAAKHVASVEIWGVRRDYIGEGDVLTDTTGKKIKKGDAIGARIQLTTLKNRLGLPFRAVNAYLYFGKGISTKWSYRELLEEMTILNEETGELTPVLKTGSWPVLTLPGKVYKGADYRGNEGTWKLMEDHWEEIEEYVESQGGFLTTANNDLADLMEES